MNRDISQQLPVCNPKTLLSYLSVVRSKKEYTAYEANSSLKMQLSRAPLLISYLAFGSFELHEGAQQACPSPWVDGTILDLGCLLFNSTMGYTWEGANVYCQGEENATLVEMDRDLAGFYPNGTEASWGN